MENEGGLLEDYSDILINDLERRLGTLDRIKYLRGTQIRNLTEANYKYVSEETMYVTVAKILLKYADDDFKHFKPKEERYDFIKMVLDSYKKKRCKYEDKQCIAYYILLKYFIDFDIISGEK